MLSQYRINTVKSRNKELAKNETTEFKLWFLKERWDTKKDSKILNRHFKERLSETN